ncbi:hypothetical protein [Cellulomonas soli]
MVEPAGMEVDSDELRHAGNRLLEASDAVLRASSGRLCSGADSWGSGQAGLAGGQFAARFAHVTRSLADELDDAGHQLRLSAEGYDYVDADVATRLTGIARDLGLER